MASLGFLPNLCHVNNLKSIRGLYFPVESHKTFCGHSGLYKPSFELHSRNFWRSEVHFFITTNFQTIVSGAQDHPTCNITSSFVPWPMNISYLVSKNLISYKAVCNKAPNTFDSITCRLAVRMRRWLLNWYLIRQRQRHVKNLNLRSHFLSLCMQIFSSASSNFFGNWDPVISRFILS